MKARIKKTGQIIDVELASASQDCAFFKEKGTVNGLVWDKDVLDFRDTIDWEQRRYEIAKDLFVAWLDGQTMATAANFAVEMADELIAELKKK